jgi:hypothetical protein
MDAKTAAKMTMDARIFMASTVPSDEELEKAKASQNGKAKGEIRKWEAGRETKDASTQLATASPSNGERGGYRVEAPRGRFGFDRDGRRG